MNSYRIYTKKTKGLDSFVWLFMILVMILSLVLLTSFLIERRKCVDFTFVITPKTDSGYFTEKNLSFALSISAKKITWDFGDGSPEKTGVYVSHQYHKAGNYSVKASIPPDCYEIIDIVVKKSPLDHSVGNEIIGPESLPVEHEVEFNCRIYASSWTWEVIDNPGIKPINAKLGSTRFRFPNAGRYFIQVTLDDDRTKSFKKEVIVTDDRVKRKPVEIDDIKPDFTDQRGPKKQETTQQPEVTKTGLIYISDKSFKDKLNDVIADDNLTSLNSFDKYLFKGRETTVQIEGSNSMSFARFYTMLQEKGDLKITGVILTRDPEDKLIVKFITVSLSR
ncbi:MAG: PKD domain-containing protein [Ferruginibacter sp.]